MSIDSVDTIALVVAGFALILSIITAIVNYNRGRKTEQIKVGIDISSRLDDAENKIFEFKDKLGSNTTDQKMIAEWKRNLRDASLLYLNHWEFFAFLKNIGELKDEKLLEYYKPNFNSGVKRWFEEYPKIRDEKEDYQEIKKLLKEWEPTYYSQHFESK